MNYTISKKVLIRGEAGEVVEDTTTPLDGVIMYEGSTIPEGYEQVSDPQSQTYVKTTPSTTPQHKVIDKYEYEGNIDNNTYSIDVIKEVFSDLYPIGAVYISLSDIDPSTIFGGEWTKVEDKYILCGLDAGNTGGNADPTAEARGTVANATLDVRHLAEHTHEYTKIGGLSGHELDISEIPEHSHNTMFMKDGDNIQSGTSTTYIFPSWQENSQMTTEWGADNPQPHYHSTTPLLRHTEATGGGQPHNHDITLNNITTHIEPPYLAVNMWYRTA